MTRDANNVERKKAEQKMADPNGYCGFSDGKTWRCIEHAIDDFLDGQWEELLAFCSGEITELPAPITEAWHDDSFQYLTSHDELAEGIYCEHKAADGTVCGTEIYPADEDYDEEEGDENE